MGIFQVDLKEYQCVVVKRIFRYLKGTSDYGIWYDRSNDFTLCTYTDADWAEDMYDIKTLMGEHSSLVED